MRLDDPDTVDYLGIEKVTGIVLITLVDEYDWSDERNHLLLLQEKMNRYFDFVESGEVYERLLETTGRSVAKGTPVKINVLAKYPPERKGVEFFEHVARLAENAGVGFSFKVLSV